MKLLLPKNFYLPAPSDKRDIEVPRSLNSMISETWHEGVVRVNFFWIKEWIESDQKVMHHVKIARST